MLIKTHSQQYNVSNYKLLYINIKYIMEFYYKIEFMHKNYKYYLVMFTT